MKKYFIIFFTLCYVFSFSQERRITRDANDDFLNKEDSLSTGIAIEKYNKAIELNNDFNTAKFNLSNSLYYEEDYEESIDLLEDVISNEVNKIKKANAYYNKGKNEISLYEKSNKENIEFLESATNSFREALKNNPNDDDTRFNLEKCLSMLNELKDQQDKENQDSEDQQDKENQDSNNQQDKDEGKENESDSKSGNTDGEPGDKEKKEIKSSQINQILKAVENKEKEVQGKVKNVNGLEIIPNIKKTEKDW